MTDRKQGRVRLGNVFALYAMEREDAGAREGLGGLRQQAIERGDGLRAANRSRTGRLEAAEFIEHGTIQMLEDALDSPQDMTALFAFVESLRARTLLDQMQLRAPSLAPEVVAVEREILRYASQSSDDPDLREQKLASKLEIARPDLIENVEALLLSGNAGFEGVAGTVSLADVMAGLQAGEVLIEYCMPASVWHLPKAIWAVIITRNEARIELLTRLPEASSMDSRQAVDGAPAIDFVSSANLAAGLTGAVRRNALDMDERLYAVYEMLIAPVFPDGLDPTVYRHLIIVPDGVLHMVPFAALRAPDGAYLGERVALSVAPSASVWHRLQQAAPPLRSFLGFGNPLVPDQPPLQYAVTELREICKLLRTRGVDCVAYLDGDATESTLKSSIAGRNMLHIAAHGAIATAEAFDFHGLLLARSTDDDGQMQAYEFRELDLREVALTVLSVCDSGTYRFGAGNELHGLLAAFLIAGAHNVVGALWPVDDAFACRLMIRFYMYLVRKGAAEALRRARADLIAQGADVRDWASFVVVGPGRRPA
jgi:hypothetical protein